MTRSANDIALYMHAGSGNHGCEAIVTSLAASMRRAAGTLRVTLMTNDAAEDLRYMSQPSAGGALGVLDVLEERHLDRHPAAHVFWYGYRRLTGDRESFLRYRFAALTGAGRPRLAVSVGGDNYCYPSMVPDLILADSMLRRQGTTTMLLGCSVEPDALREDSALRADMCAFDRIIARESVTMEALRSAGVPSDRLMLLPDPAFSLAPADVPLPAPFSDAPDEGVVGINVSPMVEAYASHDGAVSENFAELISHIIKNTRMNVALIPHVVWERSNDLAPLGHLFDRFGGSGRVHLVGDRPAAELKACIAACRFFVGARTHATIAAYSTGVPTLTAGYSVKADGIARDLFGSAEHAVLPVQQMTDPHRLIGAFEWLRAEEDTMRSRLREIMPRVIGDAEKNGEEILRG